MSIVMTKWIAMGWGLTKEMLNLGTQCPFWFPGKKTALTCGEKPKVKPASVVIYRAVCVLVSCYLCFCPAEGMYFIGAATCNVACCQFLCLCLRLRCCPLLQWVRTGLVLSGVGLERLGNFPSRLIDLWLARLIN